MEKPIFICKKFNDLTAKELYDILQLRSQVFVVEQQCVYLDCDGKDEQSFHLFSLKDNKIAAYARLLPKGLSFAEASIGRVLSNNTFRGQGFGIALMKEAIANTQHLFNARAIKIGAQLYLQKFYESFGFVVTGAVYLEDGIEHVDMILG